MLNLKIKKSLVPIKPSRWLCSVAVSVLLVSCGGGSGDGDTGGTMGTGGIIGTGVRLEGTASNLRQFASNNVEIKASTGEKTTASISNRGRFLVEKLNGTGPFLLRAATGNNEFLYSIGHPQDDDTLVQNIHSYTDAAARNWFASNGLDINTAFLSETPIDLLPQQNTLRGISNSLQAIVSGVLTEYNLPNTNLDTVSYDADDTGVDRFLDSNPVVINNNNITILIMDPDTQVITQSSTDVSLNTDLSVQDTQPPSSPTSVRALASALNEVVVVWDAAIDNIGVTAYQVFRDGALVATTPFPVYTDIGLTADTQYSYTVVAIDSSGLSSAPSLAAMSATLAAPDSIAPPAPTAVMLSPGLNSFAVDWLQSEIFDVARFNVYRSGSAEGAEALFKVTSTFITDATVLSGNEYCYQVSAVDASENESALSAEQCANTSGEITTPNIDQEPIVTMPPVMTSENLAPLVDVSGMACTEELPNDGRYTVDGVLTAGCYLAPRGIRIEEPANLAVEPGVVVKFGSSRELYVGSGASLTAIGTASAPIVFTALDPTPGFWSGVEYFFSNSSRNQLDFVQIEYAGSSATASNLLTRANSSNPTRVSIKNTTSRNSLGYGFEFQNFTVVGAFEGNRMVDNNAPLLITPDTATSIGGDSLYSGNVNDRVRLSVVDVTKTSRLAKLNVPYVSGRLNVDAVLTIEPGVQIFFESGGKIGVGQEATLKAVGTAAEPILFTATDPTPGFWTGVEFFYSSGGSELEHVTVEYGGAGSNGGNLVMKSFNSNTSRLSASNLTLRHSLNNGFVIESGADLASFENVTSTQNGRSGSLAVNVIGKLGAGSTFMGNDVDGITVQGSSLEVDATWPTNDVPYLVDDLSIKAVLTLTAGSTFVMESGGSVRVGQDGVLSAVGTALDNIVFTGKESVPGYWDGIDYFYSGSSLNRLSHVVVEYGGGGVSDATKGGNIIMKCFASNVTRLSMDNVMLNFGSGWGLFADPEGCLVTMGMNVTYTSNIQGGFNLMP